MITDNLKKDNKLNWLITGGCGFIGTNLVKHLVDNYKYNIRIVDNLSVGDRKDLSEVCEFEEITNPDKKFNGKVQLCVGDIKNQKLAQEVTKDIDCIVHFAANTGVQPSIEDPFNDCETNVLGTLNYLEAAKINKVSKFVFASSGAPLGKQEPPIHEEKVPKPIAPYGASKLSGEAYCNVYGSTFNVNTVVLRFSNVYGPRSHKKDSVVAKFIKQAMNGEDLIIYGDGKQTRDFIYVQDLVKAIIKASHPQLESNIFQIATNLENTVLEIAELVKDKLPDKDKKNINIIYEAPRKGDVLRNYSETSKTIKILKWKPEVELKEGIKKTLEYFMRIS